MSEQTTPEAKKSTPEQAEALYNWAVSATETRGTHYGHSDSFKAPVDEMPEAVAKYIPAPTDKAERVARAVYVTRDRNHKTGEFPTEGYLLQVTFDETEWQADYTQLNTMVQYHVHKNDGVFSLERHVLHDKYDPNAPHNSASFSGEVTPRQIIANLLDAQNKLQAETVAYEMEKQMGVLEVGFDEAQQVVDACTPL